jgi:hypothetical protein
LASRPKIKVNEELFLDNPLHVTRILNKSKLAYRIYVILIANKELKKTSSSLFGGTMLSVRLDISLFSTLLTIFRTLLFYGVA